MKLETRQISVMAAKRAIVQQANIAAKTGELIGLVGPNGAGKSTLLRAIAGLIDHGGNVLIDGEDISAIDPRERAKQLAFLPQDGVAEWGISARELVMLGRHPFRRRFAQASAEDHRAVASALAAVDAGEFADRPADVLSGGEKARILLARALAVGAPFLLADEPIAALDPYHQLLVMEALQSNAKNGAGIVLVLHDLALAMRFCDRIYVMDHGSIIAEGAPGDVLTPELIEQVYGVFPLWGEYEGQKWLLPWRRMP